MALQTDWNKLRREIGRAIGYGRDPAAWNSAQKIQDLQDVVDNGYLRFLYPMTDQGKYVWSFLTPNTTLPLVNGTDTYDLPAVFADMASEGFSYASGSNLPRIARISEESILNLQATASRTGAPQYFAIRTAAIVDNTPTAYEVTFYPTPDASYTVTYSYNATPSALSSSNLYPLGGPQHSETILEACLAEAEKMIDQVEGLHEKRFRELLASSIMRDQQLAAPNSVTAWPFELTANSLQVNKAYLKRLIGDQLGYGPHPGLWDHPQTQKVKLALETGLRKFYHPMILPGERNQHFWSFLKPTTIFELVSGQYEYDLPADFNMLEGLITYVPGQSALYPALRLVPENEIRVRIQRTVAAGRPVIAAVRAKQLDEAVGSLFQLLVFPVPNDAYQIILPYSINPGMMSDDAALPFGGQANMQTIIEACLCACEEIVGQPGVHVQTFVSCLAASVSHDRKVNSPDTLGINYDRSNSMTEFGRNSAWHDCQDRIVTYNGVAY